MNYSNKVVILICYYGSFPWYFSYFLHSCKFNPTIDFVIFSDIAFENELPQNVIIKKMTLGDLKRMVGEKLRIEVNIDFPYKLCDFKPAYGLIFSEYTQGYTFWGQSDIDIIFGNIRKFMTDELLNSYDYISIRHDYTTGCFALYRNNEIMNSFFIRSKDWRKVFTNSEHYCFDECNFVWDDLTEGKSIFELKTEIESFTHLIKSAEQDNEIRAHFDFILIEGLVGKIKFKNGGIVYKNRYEGILYHLFWLKQVYTPKKLPLKIPDTYKISPTRIYS